MINQDTILKKIEALEETVSSALEVCRELKLELGSVSTEANQKQDEPVLSQNEINTLREDKRRRRDEAFNRKRNPLLKAC